MRIVSFLAPSSEQAIADLRHKLGDDAIVLATKTLDDGQVSVTGAVNDDSCDLAEVLAPSEQSRSLEWLTALTDFHEWPLKNRDRLEPILSELNPAEPELVLKTLVRALFRFDDSLTKGQERLFLSGPPGCGKTVTTAKLAATHILAGDSVDVLTLDTDRAGGLDQLTALLSPLGISPVPVSTPSDLPELIAAREGDVVLVDSASANPFDPADLGTISTLASRANAELLLILPAGLGCSDSAEIARNYAALGAKAMLVTKLDVARRCGGILAAAEAGLAFTQAGIGPTIGNGLGDLSADGIARLLLRRYRSSVEMEAHP